MAYPWPGNVRQLSNVVRNVVVLSPSGVATAAMLPAVVRDSSPRPIAASVGAAAAPGHGIRRMAEVEREAIEAALAEAGGNVGRAAALLEIDASTIYRKKREWAKTTTGAPLS
jgi:two-component system repressor protein LuxO